MPKRAATPQVLAYTAHGGAEGVCRTAGARWLEQVRNAVEGDARGRGLEGLEHGGRSQGVHAVFVVQRVHGFQQPDTVLLLFAAFKEIERVQPVRHQAAQLDADEVRVFVLFAGRLLLPESGESGNEQAVVAALG